MKKLSNVANQCLDTKTGYATLSTSRLKKVGQIHLRRRRRRFRRQREFSDRRSESGFSPKAPSRDDRKGRDIAGDFLTLSRNRILGFVADKNTISIHGGSMVAHKPRAHISGAPDLNPERTPPGTSSRRLPVPALRSRCVPRDRFQSRDLVTQGPDFLLPHFPLLFDFEPDGSEKFARKPSCQCFGMRNREESIGF
jgi:hypothetical protein